MAYESSVRDGDYMKYKSAIQAANDMKDKNALRSIQSELISRYGLGNSDVQNLLSYFRYSV